MAKAPKMKGRKIEEDELKQLKLPKPKTKTVTRKRTRRISLPQQTVKRVPKHSFPKKQKKEKPKLTTDEQRRIRSEKAKEYWRKLRENDPEKYAERIRKLQEGRRRKQLNENISQPQIEENTPTPQKLDIETPSNDSGEQIPLDLDEVEEDGFYTNPVTGETFDKYKEWQESLSSPPSYDPFKEDENEVPLWDEIVLSNFLQDVYARPTLNGSRFILNWIDTLIKEYGKSFVSAMIEFAKSEGYEIDVKMLYEEDKSSAMASGFMQFWYSKGFFVDDESIQNRYDPMKKIRAKMDKEFQQSQYSFGSSLMRAIEADINADESMQNYG